MQDAHESRLVSGAASSDEVRSEVSLRPPNFKELVGQVDLVSNLKVFVSAACAREEALDHILLAGPPGLGKTTIAHLIAHELGVNLHVTSGPALERKDLAGILSDLKERDVLFIDEIHRLSPIVEENLYPAMEDFKFDITLGKGPHAQIIEMPLSHFTLVGATTRTGLLTGPMRDRFGFTGRLRYYGIDDLQVIVERSARLLNIPCSSEGALEMAKRSRGTPRIANRLLRRVRDFAEIEGSGIIDPAIARYALHKLGIDDRGFDEMDRLLLETLVLKFAGGPVGIETLATAMGEESETIEFVYEPYLIKEGFLQRTPRGRTATFQTYQYLDVPPPESVMAQGSLL